MVDRHTLSFNSKKIVNFPQPEALRFRSLSLRIEGDFNLDFVPKLKPKQSEMIPSPMRLCKKGLAELKKNKFMLEDNLY
jgi:hypothetical protein